MPYNQRSLKQVARQGGIAVCLATGLLGGLLTIPAGAWQDAEIANAIYQAEGGTKAKVAYGILSVKVRDEAEARRVCLNTIRNQRRRHSAHACGMDYLSCLAKRYAPVGAENDPLGYNKNWLRNVRYYLDKGGRGHAG